MPTIYLVMGVSGSGKSTIALALAERLGADFLDADDYHPPANVAKMKSGQPLDDADRAGWLAKLNQELRSRIASGHSAILACSALKQRYRARLREGIESFQTLYLQGDRATISERLSSRTDHFMPSSLLDSQFGALEEPRDALSIDVRLSVQEIVDTAANAWSASPL